MLIKLGLYIFYLIKIPQGPVKLVPPLLVQPLKEPSTLEIEHIVVVFRPVAESVM